MKMKDKSMDDLKLELLERTTDQVMPKKSITELAQSDKKMRIKYGVDVTAPFLHIGHAVNLWQMRHLQDLGHKVVFLIGDFTTRIGDPTGKSQTRPEIPLEEIEKNAEEFIKQVSKIVRTDEDVFEIRRNSEWYGEMPIHEFLGLLSQVTHARLIERDMFQARIKAGEEIRMHEMIYPILQGYDSYMLNADLTIVGSDQLFNENMGRFFQQRYGQEPQAIITTKITPGLDGVNKQSKSLNNYIALEDTPRDKFGKIMSLPDGLIIPYFEVYTERTNAEIAAFKQALADGENPSVVKKQLASSLVERYHGPEVAKAELDWFNNVFSKGAKPEDIPSLTVAFQASAMDIVKSAMPSQSNSQIRRLFEQGAVRINDQKIDDPYSNPEVKEGDVLKVGKKKFFGLVPPSNE